MQVGVIFLTICAYGLAIFLWSRERTPNYLVAMLGAHLAVLLSPLWQALYGFVYDTRLPALYGFGGGQLQALPRLALPWPVFLGAWLAVAPALAVFYLFRHRWWFPGYATSLLTFVLFVLYHLLIETICVRQGWLRYTRDVSLPLNVPPPLLARQPADDRAADPAGAEPARPRPARRAAVHGAAARGAVLGCADRPDWDAGAAGLWGAHHRRLARAAARMAADHLMSVLSSARADRTYVSRHLGLLVFQKLCENQSWYGGGLYESEYALLCLPIKTLVTEAPRYSKYT